MDPDGGSAVEVDPGWKAVDRAVAPHPWAKLSWIRPFSGKLFG